MSTRSRQGSSAPRRRKSSTLSPAVWHASPAAIAHRLTNGAWQWADHLELLSKAIVRTVRDSGRLIVAMPPRHGKSKLASQYGPTWFLDRFPDRMVGLASYEAEFAKKWGRDVRDTIAAHERLLNCTLDPDITSSNNWRTNAGGGMVTAGVGGPFTGYGFHFLGVDDPYKNSQEAASPTIRENVWDWWQSTAYTRLEPQAAAIVIQTRWHKDDLAGRLIREMEEGGERWEILRLPAIAEESDPLGRKPGEALWPERYDVTALARIRRAVGSYVWSALYQGNPKQMEGGMFQDAWFQRISAPPRGIVRAVRFWDLAATPPSAANPDPDYAAGIKVGILPDKRFVVLDVQRIRGTPAAVEALVRKTAERDGHAVQIGIEEEGGSSGKIVTSNFVRNVLLGFDVRSVRPTGDKVTRSGPLSAACERQDVDVVSAPWTAEFLEELTGFPDASHDDQVDAVVGAYTLLTQSSGDWNEDAFVEVLREPEQLAAGDPRQMLLQRMKGQA